MGYSSWATLNAVTQGDFVKAPTTITLSSNPDPLEVDLLPTITVTGFATQNGNSDNHIATRYTIIDVADGTVMWTEESTTNLLSITMTGTRLLPSTDYKCIVEFKGAVYGWGAPANKLFLSENIEVLAPVITGTYPNIVIATPIVDNGTGNETFTMEFKITDSIGALVAEITGIPYTANVDLDSIHYFEPDTVYTVCTRLVGSISGASDYTCNTIHTPKIAVDTTRFPVIGFPPPYVVAPDTHTDTTVVITDGTGTTVCTKNITSGNLLGVDVSSCPLNPDTDYTVCVTYKFSQTADRTYCNTIHTPAAVATIADPTFTVSGELNNVTKNPTITGSTPVVTNATFVAMEVEVTGGSAYFGVSPNWTTHYIASDLANNAVYTVKVRYKATSTLNNSTIYSNWVTKTVTTSYSIPATISTPTFTVSGEVNNVPKNATITVSQPVITGGATLQYTEWDYSGATAGGGVIYDTSNIVATTPDLTNNSSYTIRVRYVASGGLVSNWVSKSVTTNYSVATVIHPTCGAIYPDVQLSAGETVTSAGCRKYIGSTGTETVIIPQDIGGTAVSNTVETVELPFLTGAYIFSMDSVNSYVRYNDSGALRDAVTIVGGSNNVKVKCGSNSNLFAVNNGSIQRWRYYITANEVIYVPSDNFDVFGASAATNDTAMFSPAARNCTAEQYVSDIRIDKTVLSDLRFTKAGSSYIIKLVGTSIPIVTVSSFTGQIVMGKTVTFDAGTGTITIGTTVITTDTIVS